MPVYLDRDISGDGADVFPGSQVLYAVVHLTVVPVGARPLEVGSPDHILRAGWLAFGDNLPVIGVARDYWRLPFFLDFIDQMWTPDPSTQGPSSLTLVATRIRWSIGIAGLAHLYVFGQ